MNRVLQLAAVSLVVLSIPGALSAASPVPVFLGKSHSSLTLKGAKFLYNQNSNATGIGIVSQNFTSGTFSPTYNSQGADDFVVPAHTRWTVTEVDVSGLYFNGSGPANSENIIFYKDQRNEPGKAVKNGTFIKLAGKDESGSFAIKLPHQRLILGPGTYWVSVFANCPFETCGEWGWEVNSVIHGNEAMWRNPGGCCCPSWVTLQDCLGYSDDFMFDLRGTARHE